MLRSRRQVLTLGPLLGTLSSWTGERSESDMAGSSRDLAAHWRLRAQLTVEADERGREGAVVQWVYSALCTVWQIPIFPTSCHPVDQAHSQFIVLIISAGRDRGMLTVAWVLAEYNYRLTSVWRGTARGWTREAGGGEEGMVWGWVCTVQSNTVHQDESLASDSPQQLLGWGKSPPPTSDNKLKVVPT